MIYVVIPYVSVGAQGSELEYAIRGWLRHFKEKEFRVVVVGDWHPCLVKFKKGVEYLPCPKVHEVQFNSYLPHIDIVRKIHAFLRNYITATEFIYAADDVYAVDDFSLESVRTPKWRLSNVPSVHHTASGWALDLGHTHEVLRRYEFPERCYVTHAPVLFESNLFWALSDVFGLADRSYVFEDLYFNIMRPEAERLDLSDMDKLALYIINYGLKAPTIEEVRRDVERWNPIWLNNGVQGWSEGLEQYLKEHFN